MTITRRCITGICQWCLVVNGTYHLTIMPGQNHSVPFEIRPVDQAINKRLLKDFTGERRGFFQVGPKNYLLPSRYAEEAADFYHFNLRPDDLWVNTFPRSGTTLTQELIWLIANDLDFDAASKIPLVKRFPFLEGSIQSDPQLMAEVLERVRGNSTLEEVARRYGDSKVPELELMQTRRFIKTHLPFSLLPPSLLDTCKTVYVARNPKDVIVSYYHHNRLLKALGYVGDFDTYYRYFEQGLLPWSPYWDHIREAWLHRHHPNLLFLFYEDLVTDTPRTIRRVAEFLGKSLTDQQVTQLTSHLHIDNFRNNPSTNLDFEALPGLRAPGEQKFIRKGKVGGWRDCFTSELSDRADTWIQNNISDLPHFTFPKM